MSWLLAAHPASQAGAAYSALRSFAGLIFSPPWSRRWAFQPDCRSYGTATGLEPALEHGAPSGSQSDLRFWAGPTSVTPWIKRQPP